MLRKIRKILKEQNASHILILSADFHLSEYISPYFKIREYISNFSGSAGSLLIGQDEALLFTDGRYFLQAEQELSDEFRLIKSPDYIDYIKNNLKNEKILLDLRTISKTNYDKLSEFARLYDYAINYSEFSSHSLPENKVYYQNERFIDNKNKIQLLQAELEQKNIDYCVISSLSDIAYLSNLRGSDVAFNPVFLSYLIVSKKDAVLYINAKKLSDIEKDSALIYKDYDEFYADLAGLSGKVLCDFSNTNAKITSLIKAEIINEILPSTMQKACKSPKEINHLKYAHLLDGIALCKFNHWLENTNLANIDECDIDEVLTSFRASCEHFISNSFDTIAGFNENGAIIHYRAKKASAKKLSCDGLLLLDSGAQYECGTTDITRVFRINKASSEQIRDYTLVLKANIAISKTVYPENIKMPLLDSIARKELWQYGLDYLHGTGHGVGYFLNVHEGPQVLSLHAQPGEHTRVKRGMLTSIEPGLYHTNKYGIRLENLAISEFAMSSEYGDFLRFDIVTLYPFELDLIDENMLNTDEIKWINEYHLRVFKALSPYLDDNLKEFLRYKCREISIKN